MDSSKEIELLDDIVNLHNKYLKLEVQHPCDQSEWCGAIHDLQKLLAMRIVRKDHPDIFPIKTIELEIEEYGLCEECGVYPADYPSKLCCGCNDYKDHLC